MLSGAAAYGIVFAAFRPYHEPISWVLPEKMKLNFLLFLIISLMPVHSQAQDLDLYTATVAVADQSQAAREAAFPLALVQVLGKLSGLQNFESNPEVATAAQNARSLVVSFYYDQLEVNVESNDSLSADRDLQAMQTQLVARFAQVGVDQLLRDLALPRWPPVRPALSVWLLIDDGLSRRVLPVEYEYLRRPLQRVADVRGLPLIWPQPTDNGTYNVDVQLLWGGYTETLEQQGNPGRVLIIAARREGPEWSARLNLEYEDENRAWRSRNISLEEALIVSMHQVVDEIALVHAIAPSQQGNWVFDLSVDGISTSEDYARCLAYLESLSIVDDVAIEAANPASISMSLSLNATPDYLQQALDDDGVLEYEDGSGHYVLQQ